MYFLQKLGFGTSVTSADILIVNYGYIFLFFPAPSQIFLWFSLLATRLSLSMFILVRFSLKKKKKKFFSNIGFPQFGFSGSFLPSG